MGSVAVLVFASLGSAHAQDPLPHTASAYRDFAVRRDGNAQRGREIFFNTSKVACAPCHSIDGSSSQAGPDLAVIGDALPRRELINAILEPNAAIAVGYEATIVETTGGATAYGVIKQFRSEMIELMGADARPVRIPLREIKAQRVSPVSLMPEGVHAGLSLQEFTDLIEFLTTLKQPANALSAHRGLPDAIPELARPVVLRPFFPEELRLPANMVRTPGVPRVGPVWFGQVPGQRNAFLVLHQAGKIWRMEKNPAGDTRSVFADFSSEVYSERGPNGLLGLAFHPKFRENRKYYLHHQLHEQGRMVTALVEKRAAADFRRDSGEPSRRLLTIECATENHTGGTIAFGPDGYLYLGMGDTGPQRDPNGHGQDMKLFLGKMLRLDVDRREDGKPYAIPADNPFRDRADARPEIFALGFREPWRFSFDPANGDLWVGDVGQDRVEEVTIVRRGENHGWNAYEGFDPFALTRRREGETYVPPVFAYKRKYGNSVTGGHVYRGDPRSSFHGVYICGDFTSKYIWGLTQENRELKSVWKIGACPEPIASFATDEAGEIYVVGYEGTIYKMDFSGARFGETAKTARAPSWERHAFPLPESIWSVEAIDAKPGEPRELIAMGVTKVFALSAPQWTPRILFDAQEGKMLYCVALDANRDGATDLALGRYQIPWIEFRQGKAATEPKGPDFSVAWIENPRDPTKPWPMHVLDRELNGIHGLCVGDVDGDGRPDVIADSISGPAFPNSVAWIQTADGSQPPTRRLITRNGADGRPHYLEFADVNGDGRGDVLLGDSGAGTFTWWERGARLDEPWTKHRIAQEKGATNIRVADVNGDGRADVIGSCGHGIGVFWFEGPGWKKHVIDAALATPHALGVGDFDGDGDIDVATASYTAFVVRWYENDGRGGFTPHDIDTQNKQQAYDLKVTDLDRDGRLDLILAGRESRNVVWYRNFP